MDNYRRYSSPNIRGRQQALDGFFAKPDAAARRPAAGRRPYPGLRPGSQLPAVDRRVDDFGRRSGFHTPPAQRQLASGFRPARPQLAASRSQLRSPGLDMALPPPAYEAHRPRHKTAVRHRPWHALRVWTFRAAVASLVLVMLAGGLLFAKGYLKLHKMFQGNASAAALQANVDPNLLKGEGDGRINILILGIGGPGHDGSDLTDTMIVASIDPVNNKAVLLSVPRDLWVKMPNNYIANYQKINAAYESGKYKYLGRDSASNSNHNAIDAGFQAADSTVEKVLGVPIHYNVLVNFSAFRQAVDTVGGVTVNVPTELYDPTMAWENHWNPVLARPGVQHMNGAQALLYVRSRETTSDFARAARQRAVMVALKDKVFTMGVLSNPFKLSSLISAFGDNVVTDISMTDMMRLVAITQKIPNNDVQSLSLVGPPKSYVTTGAMDGLSIVEPLAGLENYSDIHTYVRSELKDGYITKENAKVELLNGTVVPGLATQKGSELQSYGYNVVKVDNAPTSDYQQTTIIDLSHGADKYTLHYLENRFGVHSVSTVLPAGVQTNGANIVIILGQDEASTT